MKEKEALNIIGNFNREHGYSNEDVVFIEKLREAKLTDIQIASVINAIDTTCNACYDHDYKISSPCYCMADD